MNIKPFKQIVSEIISWVVSNTKKITDFNVGSVIRTMIEAISVELEEIYYHMWFGFRDAVKQAIFYAFDFHYKESTYATTTLTFTRVDTTDTSVAITIPAGTTVSTPEGIYFSTDNDCTIAIGATSTTVTATCQTAGTTGNVAENTITVVITGDLQSSVTVNNSSAVSDGTEQETDEEIKTRFQEYIQSLSKGTLSAIEYGAKTITGVLNAKAVDHYLGEVYLYVWDINGNLTSTMKTAIEDILDNWRAGGIQVSVFAPTKTAVDVILKVQVSDLNAIDTATLTSTIEANLLALNNTIELGKTLNLSEIISTTMNSSIYITDVKITQPTADVTAQTYEIVLINSITISEITESEI